jgi:hypothetical protein
MSTGPSVGPQIPAGLPQGSPPKNSGAKVLLWVLGGFAAFMMLAIIGFSVLGFFVMHKAKQAGLDLELMKKNPGLAAAKMAVAGNPDVQLVSSNDSMGTIVVRDKKTNKLTTLKFDPQKKSMVVIDDKGQQAKITADTSSGTLRMESSDGSVTLGAGAGKAPAWVPQYPESSPQANFSSTKNGRQSGSFAFVSSDSVEKIVGYYSDTLKSAGFSVTRTGTASDTISTGIVNANDSDHKRSLTVSIQTVSDGTHVLVNFDQIQ